MTEREREEAWRARLQTLPRDLGPRRDLWPAIEARLADRDDEPASGATAPRRQGRRGARSGWALAASLALVVLAGLLLEPLRDAPPTDDRDASLRETARAIPAPTDPVTSGGAGPWPWTSAASLSATLTATEREYRSALLAFSPVTKAAPLVGPQAAGDIQGSWTEMQQAEAQLLAALDEHPDHRLLATRLIDLRARQLDLLRRLHRLAQERLVYLDAPPAEESREPMTLRARVDQSIWRET